MKSKCKKLFAIIVSVALVASCLLTAPIVGVNAAVAQVYTGDNFDDGTAENLNLTTGAEVTDGRLHLKAATSEKLTVDDSVWPASNRTTKVSFDFQGTNGNGKHIMFAYDKTGGNGVGLFFSNDNNAGLMIRAGYYKSGNYYTRGDNGSKLLCPVSGWCNSGDYAVVSTSANIHIDAVIKYTSNTSVTITYTLTAPLKDSSGNFTNTKTFTDKASALGLETLPETMGFAIAPSNELYIDNLVIESYASEANAFCEKHNEVLSKSAETFTDSDVDKYVAAASDYELLSDGAKKLLTDEKTKLDALDGYAESHIPAFYEDDFSNAYYTSKYWSGAPKIQNDGTNDYITLSSTNGVVLSENYFAKGTRPTKITLRYKALESGTKINFAYDAEKTNGAGIVQQSTTKDGVSNLLDIRRYEVKGGTQNNYTGDPLGAIVSPWLYGADAGTLHQQNYPFSQWMTIVAEFDYSQIDNGQLIIKYVLKAALRDTGEVVEIPQRTYTYTLGNDNTAMSDLRLAVTGGSINLSYICVETVEHTIGAYTEKYSDLINKNVADVTSDDSALLAEAIAEYEQFTDYVKSNETLYGFYSKFVIMTEKLGNEYDYNSDDIDSMLNVNKKIKYSTDAKKNYLFEVENQLVDDIENYSAALPNDKSGSDDKVRIFTVGHSMVAGMNANKPYPAQLQQLINADENLKDKYTVGNIGCSGTTAAEWLSDKWTAYVKSQRPNVIILTIGGNDLLNNGSITNYKENLCNLINYYQNLESQPTVILTTEMHWTGRNVNSIISVQRAVAEELSLPLIDFKTYTENLYNRDYQNFIDAGQTEDEATASVRKLWFTPDVNGNLDGIHYTDYAYGLVAEYVKTFIDNSYVELSVPYTDVKNVEFYSDSDKVDASSIDSKDDFNALTYAQKKYYKHFFRSAYNELFASSEEKTAADNFKSTYADIINKTDVTLSDNDSYIEAANAYKALSAISKNYVSSEHAKLVEVGEKLTALLSEEYIKNGIADSETVDEYNIKALNKAYSELNVYTKEQKQENAALISGIYKAISRYSGTKTADTKIRVACVGDSITAGSLSGSFLNPTPYPIALQNILGDNYIVSNYGVHGRAYSSGYTASYDTTSAYTSSHEMLPNIVIIMLGTNDINVIGKGGDASELGVGSSDYNDLLNIVNSYRGLESAPQIILANIPWGKFHETYTANTNPGNPERIANINAMIALLAENENIPLVDVYSMTKEWPDYDSTDSNTLRYQDDLHYSALGHQEFAKKFAETIVKGVQGAKFGHINTVDYSAVQFKSNYSIGEEITAADFAKLAAARKEYNSMVVSESKAEIEAFMTALETAFNPYRATISGATIKTTDSIDKQDLRYNMAAPTSTCPDGMSVVEYGAIFLPKNLLGDNELTLDTAKVAVARAKLGEGEAMPKSFYANLGGSAVNGTRCSREIAARTYVIYSDGTNQYVLYNSGNPDGSEGNECVRSVYGVARKIANAVKNEAGIVFSEDTIPDKDADISTIDGEKVLKFIIVNKKIISDYVNK